MPDWPQLAEPGQETGLEIGEAEKRDIPALVSLLADLFTLESDFRPDPVKQAQGLALLIGCPIYGRIFVARYQNTVAGMVSALFTVSTAEGGPSSFWRIWSLPRHIGRRGWVRD